MISLTSRHRYWLYRGAVDMRRSFNGLGGIVNREMSVGLLSGDVFIFINRRRDSMKLLLWESGGFAIWYKRLEAGTFELPGGVGTGGELELGWEELMLILGGIRLESVRRHKRFRGVSK